MSFSGSLVQNAIYIAGEAEWPIARRGLGAGGRGEARPGPVRLHRGRRGRRVDGAREPRGVRARRLRPRMLAGNIARDLSVEVLGTRSPAPFLLAPVGVLSIAHEEAELAVGAGRRRVRRAVRALERGVALDRGGRRGDGRRAALVPALLGQRPRGRRELRRAGRGGGLRRDRRHARHAAAGLAPARPAQRLPAVPAAARAAASSSPTRSSCRGSTSRRPRTS